MTRRQLREYRDPRDVDRDEDERDEPGTLND